MDIYNTAFIEYFVFYGSNKKDVKIDSDAVSLLNSNEFGTCGFVMNSDFEGAPAPVPYVVGRQKMWQPWRMYPDTHGTMVVTLKPFVTQSSLYATIHAQTHQELIAL